MESHNIINFVLLKVKLYGLDKRCRRANRTDKKFRSIVVRVFIWLNICTNGEKSIGGKFNVRPHSCLGKRTLSLAQEMGYGEP